MGEVGTKAFTEGKQEIAELNKLSVNAPPFAKPLRQFLQTIDDRKRAIENDPRAKETAPPAPDPTAISGEGGFTGMEAIWNYFFWQTLSINMLDDTAHMLRASLTADPQCMQFINSQAGPGDDRQVQLVPGPVPARHPQSRPARRRLERRPPRACARTPASRPAALGERRGEGMPEAGPLPGQPDLSKPQIVLPPDVQHLLDSLSRSQRQRLKANPDELRRELDSIGAPTDRPGPPASSSTTCSRHETKPRTGKHHRQPGPDRGHDRADRAGRRVHRVQRELGPAVRADLRPEGRAALRRQAGEGQRGARGRLPGGRREGDHARRSRP